MAAWHGIEIAEFIVKGYSRVGSWSRLDLPTPELQNSQFPEALEVFSVDSFSKLPWLGTTFATLPGQRGLLVVMHRLDSFVYCWMNLTDSTVVIGRIEKVKIQATCLHDWWLRLHIFSGLDEAKKKIDIPQEDRPASWLRFHLGWGMVVLIAERCGWIDTLQIFGVEELKNIK